MASSSLAEIGCSPNCGHASHDFFVMLCKAREIVDRKLFRALYIVVVVLHLKLFNKEPFSVLDSATCRKF